MQISKKNKIKILLTILPLFLILSGSVLKNSLGEYYLNLYDPSYVYLINSLNLSQMSGYGVGHVDHPGTPLQITGAVIIKIYHYFSNNATDIVNDVLDKPEQYLYILNKVFVIINAAALFALGIIVFNISGNFLLSIFLQLSPFISKVILYGLIDVSPDNYLILSSLMIAAMLIVYLFSDKNNTKASLIYILLFSIICGFGIASKLNFIPILFIPLIILKNVRSKLIFIFFTIFFFLLFVLPAIENYQYFFSWIKNLYIHKGIYGTGTEGVINFPKFIFNIGEIFSINFFFGLIYILSFTTFLYYHLKLKKITLPEKLSKPIKDIRVLAALLTAFTIQIIIVAKHYHPYSQKYMIPSIMLSLTALLVCVRVYFHYSETEKKNPVYLKLIILVIVYSIFQFYSINSSLKFQNKESAAIENFIKENYSQNFIISDLESSDSEKSLAFNIFYSGSQTDKYMDLLSKNFTSNIFYSGWADQFIYTSDTVKIRNNILKEEKIILQISKFASLEKFSAKLKELCKADSVSTFKIIENNNGESIYEAIIVK